MVYRPVLWSVKARELVWISCFGAHVRSGALFETSDSAEVKQMTHWDLATWHFCVFFNFSSKLCEGLSSQLHIPEGSFINLGGVDRM